MQNFALIQPRTSPSKIWKQLLITNEPASRCGYPDDEDRVLLGVHEHDVPLRRAAEGGVRGPGDLPTVASTLGNVLPNFGVHCVDLGESFQTHVYLQNLASIQPRTSPLKFARSTDPRVGRELPPPGPGVPHEPRDRRDRGERPRAGQRRPGRQRGPRKIALGVMVSNIGKILQIFSGLVLGCIKTKFCNKICV